MLAPLEARVVTATDTNGILPLTGLAPEANTGRQSFEISFKLSYNQLDGLTL